MESKQLFARALLPFALLGLSGIALADESAEHSTVYKLLTTISIPNGGLTGFDIGWVDAQAGRFYLADRGGTSGLPRIDVIDTHHLKVLYQIPMPAPATGQPPSTMTPNGVLTFHGPGHHDEEEDEGESGILVAGLNNSSALFVDLSNRLSTPLMVSTGGTGRADELAYDPRDQVILIANDNDPVRFVTFISTKGHPHVVGKISYPQATNGLEQPVWDGAKRRFYLAIPATTANPKGEVDEIDPVKMKITRVFPTSCGPAGLALLPKQHLITSCGDVIEIADNTRTTVAGVGGDEIWYNPGDGRVYFGGGTDRISVPVVSAAEDPQLITSLTVGTKAVTPNHTTHTLAADRENNRLFVPVGNEGVKVYTEVENDDPGED
jgi:hypothetical protein